jgi:RepB DNA-primase from phage plasmid/Primase C terminal 1 (PriCT-1)
MPRLVCIRRPPPNTTPNKKAFLLAKSPRGRLANANEMMVGLHNNIVLAGEFSNGRPHCSTNNSDAERWATTLFEPTDILEIRCLPSKEMAADLSPLEFTWKQTFQRDRFDPWVRAGEITTLIDRLREFNSAGITTYWLQQDHFRCVRTIDFLPLNIYCSANPRTRVGGTKSKDVALARSLFVDLDDISAGQAAEKVRNSGLPTPSMTVNSGHGVHLYWRLLDAITDLIEWKSLQKCLIQLLGSDPSIHDPARMMRLPGFANLNGEPAPCRILDADGDRRYALDEIDAVLPQAEDRPRSMSTATSSLPIVDPDRESIFRRALAYANKVPLVPHGRRNSTIFKLATNLRERFGLTASELLQMTKLWNARLDEPLDYGELHDVTKKAFRFVDSTNLPRDCLRNAPPPIKIFEEPEGPVVFLADWRNEMQAKRLDSLKEPPQVYFDRSTTGAGKSTADLVAMKEAGQSLTLLPTHEACEELAEKMRKEGLDAAAFPALDESSCQRFGNQKSPGDAQIAQRAGLDVGRVLCPECQFYRSCEYQKRRERARNAPHAVATHARAAHSDFAIAQDKPIVFVHEDCRDLLRPMMRITANRTSLDPNVRHLEEILRIAEEAIDLTEVWHDRAKQDFAINLHKSIKQLIAHLNGSDLLEEVREANAAGFLDEVARVKSLDLRSRVDRPDRSDYLLYRAMRKLGLNANGEALRLCLAYACGELKSLTLVIDDTFTRHGKNTRQFHQSLVGVRRLALPEQLTIWFEDATGDHDLISELVQHPIADATPVGRLEFKVPPIQYSRSTESDVTLQTAGNTVRALIRGLLLKHPSAKSVGVITHRRHLPEIGQLEPLWRSRLSKLDYFRSGNDRASNKWLECDLLLIVGTPRVPPSAVREALIQAGDVDAAGRDGRWRSHVWQGRTLQGDLIDVHGLGYEDPSWSRMHQILVRSNLQQAVGRGRGVIESGVQVVVVSNESLGVPFAADTLELLKDPEARTLQTVTELSAVFPTVYTVGEIAVSVAQIVSQLAQGDELAALKERQVRTHLSALEHKGLLARKGARGGWMPGPVLDLRT